MDRKIPAVADAETAVRIFYSCDSLGPTEIKQIFNCADGVARRLRRYVEEDMREEGLPIWNPCRVNTDSAFRSWGIDVKRLENGLQRLRNLGLRR